MVPPALFTRKGRQGGRGQLEQAGIADKKGGVHYHIRKREEELLKSICKEEE